ncbi:MAG: repeat containing protein [Flavipsychrobacter sp.]|nr:repeat containing protein [Flavipsychrobacter sp.]
MIDAIGNMYISVSGVYHNLRKVDTAGIIHAFVGGSISSSGFSGDGGPATAARIDEPRGITFDKKGNVYFFDRDNKRVRKVDTAGIITTFAGNGSTTSSGDGGPATAAGIGIGAGLCSDTAGNIYIGADNFIRKVDTAGIITAIAGTGVGGYSGDGGMADTAQIETLNGQIVVDKYGNLYMTASGRVRKINAAGIITTIAGNGTPTYSGDGGPATAAGMNIYGVYPDSNGNIYIADHDPGHRIRKVNSAGIITSIAGTTNGFSGDGGPGTSAKMFRPRILCLGKNNCL